jgi:hypothetical protein
MTDMDLRERRRLAGRRPEPDQVLPFWRWDSILLLGDSERFRRFWGLVESSQELQGLCEPGVYPSERLHPLVFLLRDIYLHFLQDGPRVDRGPSSPLDQYLEIYVPQEPDSSDTRTRPRRGNPGRKDSFWNIGRGEATLALLAEVVREIVGPRRYWDLSLKLLRHFSGGFRERTLKKNPEEIIRFDRAQLRYQVKAFRRLYPEALVEARIRFREQAQARTYL